MNMKRSILLIALFAALVLNASAKLGYTLDQCREYYGHEVKSEPAWCGGTAYSFVSDGLYIYAILDASGKVSDVTYFDNKTWKPFPQKVKDYLYQYNIDRSRLWCDSYTGRSEHLHGDWDGREGHKSLGMEHGLHNVLASYPDRIRTMIENGTDKGGWQYRTGVQFWYEQSFMKANSKIGTRRVN